MVRNAKILLAMLVATWGAIGAMGNLAHWDRTTESVRSVVSMEWIGETKPPQATTSPVVVWLGALTIVSGKIAAAVLCGFGAIMMLGARNGDPERFQHAKRFAILGCALAVAMLYGAFIVVAESLFLMWRTDFGEAAAAGAFRYGGFIALVMIFLAQRE